MRFLKTLPYLALPLFSNVLAEESPWEITGAAGLSYAEGNSESLAYSMQLLGSYIAGDEEFYFGTDYFYSEDGVARSADSLKIFGQYNHNLSERFYVGGYMAYLRDSVAEVDYRIDPTLVLGYRAIAEDDMNLVFEAGPGYTWLERGGVSSDFATVRFTQRFDWNFSENSKFWQSASITPSLEDFSNYLLDFEAGIDTRITADWSLRTFVRHRLDSEPAAGSEKADTSLIVGLAYELGGLSEPAADEGGRRSLMPGEEAAPVAPKGWVSVAALGATLSQGNAESAGLALDWNTAYRSDDSEFFFDFLQVFQEDNGATARDQTASRVQFNRLLSDRVFLGARVNYLRDGLADIDYRVTPGFIAGYKVITTDQTSLSFEAGPSFTFESQGGVTDSYASIFLAERFSHKFNERFTYNQALEYTAEAGDLNNYWVLATAALDTKISDRLILRVAGTYAYDNQPAAGREKSDISLISSVAVRF